MRRAAFLPWMIGGGLVIVLLAGRVIAGISGAIGPWHCDLANLWAAGHFVDAGDWRSLYDPASFSRWQAERFGPIAGRFFSYPPTIFPLVQVIATLPYRLALLLWLGVTGWLFLLVARRWWPATAGPRWLALLTPAALLNISFGQSGFLFGALWLAVFALADRRPLVAGLLVAGFTAKPQLAVLIPLILIGTGRWRAVAGAAIGSLGWVAATCALYGADPWRQFFGVAAPRQAGFVDAGHSFIGNLSTSTATMLHQWTGDWTLAWLGHAAVAGWALWVLVSAMRDRAPARELATIGATATFLVLPYALAYDLTVPAIAALAVIGDPRAGQTERRLATIGFVAPQLAAVIGAIGLPVLPIALVLQLHAQHRCRAGAQPSRRFKSLRRSAFSLMKPAASR